MMRLKLKKRKILVIIIILFLFFVTVLLLLHAPFFRTKVLGYVTNFFEQKKGISLTAQSLDYNLLRLRFTFKGVEIKDSGKDHLYPFFQADEVKIKIPLALLLGNKLQIQELEIQNPKIAVHIDQEGRSNIPFKTQSKTKSPGQTKIPEFVLNKVQVQNAWIHFKDERRKFEWNLPGLKIGLHWIGKGRHSFYLEMDKNGSAIYKEHRSTVDEFRIKADLDYQGIDVQDFILRIPQNRLEFNGRVELFSSASIDGILQGEIDLGDVLSLLYMDSALAGKIKFHSYLGGSLEDMDAHIQVESDNLHFKELQDIGLNAELRWKDRRLILQAVHMDIANGEIQGHGEYHPLKDKAENRIELQWTSVDLERLDFLVDRLFPLISTTSGSIQAFWSGSALSSLKGRAEIRLRAKNQKSEQGIPLSGSVLANFDSGRITLSTKDLTMPGARFTGEFRVAPRVLGGRFTLEASELKDLSPLFLVSGRDMYKKEMQALNLSGQLHVAGIVEGRLESPSISAELKSPNLSVLDWKNLQLDGILIYDAKGIRLKPIRIQEGESRLEISGFYSLMSRNQSVKFDVWGEQIFFERVLKAFHLDIPAKAKIDFRAHIEGDPLDPNVEAALDLTDFSYHHQDFEKVKIVGNYRKKHIFLDSLEAKKSGGKIEAKGWYNIEEDVFNIDLSVDSLLLQNISFTHPEKRMDATVDFKLKGKGKINAPQIEAEGLLKGITVDGKKMGDIKLQAKGDLPFKTPSVSGLILEADIDLAFLSSFLGDSEATGMLKFRSRLAGTFSDLEMTADIDLSEAKIGLTHVPLSFEDIQLHLGVSKNVIKIDSFSFRIGNSRCQVAGDVPLESLPLSLPGRFHVFEKRAANISLFIQNLDPSLLKTILPLEMLEQMSGKIDGKIEVTGESLQWDKISAEASFDSLELNLFGISLAQENSTHLLLRNGQLSVQRLHLRGEANRIEIRGSVGLEENNPMDISLGGELELKIFRGFLPDALISGMTDFQVRMSGIYGNPLIEGFIDVRDFGMKMTYPLIFLSRINGRLRVRQDGIEIEQLRGDLNGGKLNLKGDIGFSRWTFTGAEVLFTSEDSLFDYPKDLRSQISSELRLKSDGKNHLLSGKVMIVNAKYIEPFGIQSAIFRYLRRKNRIEDLREPSPFFSNLVMDVAVHTINNFLIDNNISKSEAKASLKLAGNIYHPALAGRVEFFEGGEVYFSHNTFYIERGTVDFVNPNRIEPDVNLTARTQVNEYDIQLILTGTPDRFSASFVSDPALSEPNIISLLVTGRTLESASASVLDIAGNKALSYIDNVLTGKVEQALAGTLGLESVRIDASLVSTEENPGARITVGQHISRSFELVLSQDLKDAQNRTWIVNYNPNRKVNLQGVKNDDNEYNISLRHELLFGSAERPGPTLLSRLTDSNLTVGRILLEGHLGVSERIILRKIKLAEGKRFDFYKLQESLDLIRRYYGKNHYLSFSLNTIKETKERQLNLTFHIDSGPKIHLKYLGTDIPKRLEREIINVWMGSSFGPLVIEDIKHRLRLHLLKKRYYQATVQAREQNGQGDERIIFFQVSEGLKYDKPEIIIEGTRFFSETRLLEYLNKNHLVDQVFVNPQSVKRNLEDLYAQNGFLRSKVHLSQPYFDPEKRKVHMHFQVEEGASFKIGKIMVNGSQFLSKDQLIDEIDIQEGDSVSLKKFNEADYKIREIYAQKGFNDVHISSQIQIHKEEAVVDLTFDIDENHKGEIAEIQISGNSITHKKVIQRELLFKEGDVVNFRPINESRKRLYDLGIFERVNIDVAPLSQEQDISSKLDERQEDSTRFYRVGIDVVELKPYRLRYGLQYDTESAFGASGNLINRNLLGRAQLLGTSFRFNRDERDLRAFLRSPYFFSKRISTEFFTFVNRTIKPSFTADRLGFTLQQQVEFSKGFILSYNYSFERNHTFVPDVEEMLDPGTWLNICTLNVGLTWDTRDNILNPSRGMSLSQNIRYAPEFLGSDVRFIRYFGQYYTFRKLSNFLVYAFGLRLGLSKGWDQDIIPSERFFAGGGTTVRGFGKNEVGPEDPDTGLPVGGESLFVMNQELRFPLFKKLSGVVFIDIGNVYSKVSDFNPFEVRETAGFGLRYQTPFALLRFDWGFKLDRRPGEPLSKIFFSIGQAF